jgi:hypothetical protein
MAGTHHAEVFTGLDGVPPIFCPGWPPIVILLISVSIVVRIIGMSSSTWHILVLFIPLFFQ